MICVRFIAKFSFIAESKRETSDKHKKTRIEAGTSRAGEYFFGYVFLFALGKLPLE